MKILNYSLIDIRTNGKYYLIASVCLIGILVSFLAALPKTIFQSDFTKSSLRIGIVVPEDSFFRDMIETAATSNDAVEEVEIFNHSQAKQAFQQSKIDIMIELPKNIDEIMFNKEQGTIDLYAKNPLIGKIMYQILNSTVHTVNTLQLTSLNYYEQIIKSSLDPEKKELKIKQFDEQLIEKVITRATLTKIYNSGSQYSIQLWSLIYFFILTVFSIFNVQIYAKRKQMNVLKKLLFYGFKTRDILLVKLIFQQVIVGIMTVISYFGFQTFTKLSFWYVFLCMQCISFFTLTLFYLIYTLWLNYKNDSTVFIILSTLNLTFLFLGGLIFPLYDLHIWINHLNPAWYIQLCVSYLLANQIPVLFLVKLGVLSLFFGTIVYWKEVRL